MGIIDEILVKQEEFFRKRGRLMTPEDYKDPNEHRQFKEK